MMRSIAPALLLFASATSFNTEHPEQEADVAEYHPEQETELPEFHQQQEAGLAEYYPEQEAGLPEYHPQQDAQHAEYYPEQEAGFSEYHPQQEAEYAEYYPEQDAELPEHYPEQETDDSCIEDCHLPCNVQELLCEKIVDEDEKPLTINNIEQMCEAINEAEGDAEEIFQYLLTLYPHAEDEILAYGLNVLQGKLADAKEALGYAVNGESIWDVAEVEIEGEAEIYHPASNTTTIETVEIDLPVENFDLDTLKDTVNDEMTGKPTHDDYRKADSNRAASTSPALPVEAYELELPAKNFNKNINKDTVERGMKTKATDGDNRVPVKADDKLFLNKAVPALHALHARKKHVKRPQKTKVPVKAEDPYFHKGSAKVGKKKPMLQHPAHAAIRKHFKQARKSKKRPVQAVQKPYFQSAEKADYDLGAPHVAKGKRSKYTKKKSAHNFYPLDGQH